MNWVLAFRVSYSYFKNTILICFFHVPFISCVKAKRTVHARNSNKNVCYLKTFSIFSRVHKVVKSDDYFRHVCLSLSLSLSLYRTTRLPRDVFSWNLIFENFSKICRENSTVIKNLTRTTGTLQGELRTCVIISRRILVTMRNISDKVVVKIKTRILCSVTVL